jgi:hypothetical protein
MLIEAAEVPRRVAEFRDDLRGISANRLHNFSAIGCRFRRSEASRCSFKMSKILAPGQYHNARSAQYRLRTHSCRFGFHIRDSVARRLLFVLPFSADESTGRLLSGLGTGPTRISFISSAI